MEDFLVKAEVRKGRGKSNAKSSRRAGFIPCVLYGRGVESLGITISSKDWQRLRKNIKRNSILKMELDNDGNIEQRPVMIKDIQRGIVKNEILHIDFIQVSMQRKIEIEVPISLVGEAKGLIKNGIVDQHLRTIMVECLPSEIPEKIDIDITNLDIGDTVHASEISIPGVKVIERLDVAIVTVVPPPVDEEKISETETAEEKKEA
ncbi:MAG TPA: 50S ribosomal protein L25 [Syntrophorhabdaceae bacterium]|jgi:large subunit ribosomal protein L25|nr:50S ribosomal protein L25 [Syntrophorhabdaceae bacterium]OQC47088.1 MAG: 50S ribosomal protein L25 [Deltaproteobacteria bacterium ADurb.Bin026]MBV6506920.1 50S ribosomal protein L25 [Syntrophorhabdaceae bacterium]HNQ63774.1 50S ribosomal protein L25 [Syntrophorhabdaceae bacterium]HNZ58453.1 50S ribosomal protein L25 [Syntrophorhabdaceae bacterium]